MRTTALGCIVSLVIFVSATAGPIGSVFLPGESHDCYVLTDLLGGVSAAIARIAGLSYEIETFRGYQVADRAFVLALEIEAFPSLESINSHLEDVYERVADLAVALHRDLTLYIGLNDYWNLEFRPHLWCEVDPAGSSGLRIEYLDARPTLQYAAESFGAKLDEALGAAVTLSWDGCIAIPGLGVHIDLASDMLSYDLPRSLDEQGEWVALLLEVLERDGEFLLEHLADDERLVVVTPEGLFGTDDFWRLYFSIPSGSYLDVSTWQVFAQLW